MSIEKLTEKFIKQVGELDEDPDEYVEQLEFAIERIQDAIDAADEMADKDDEVV